MIKVVFFQRKRYSTGNFSLEFIFDDVRARLNTQIVAIKKISSFTSNGFFPRLFNILEAPFFQAEVNHITGDIHYIALLLKKNKTILTILDCGFLNMPESFKRKVLKFFWLTMPVARVKYITTISEASKIDILKNCSCDPDKIKVIPVAVANIYQPVPTNFNKAKPRLLQIGTAPNKNIPRLIEAIKDIPCHLVIIGKIDNTLISQLEQYSISYENKYNLSIEELYEEYKKCDILTFVSTFEGFGMPIIEANCVERPVITGNITSMPEIAGNAACIVDPFDMSAIKAGILKIIQNDTFRNTLIENGKSNKNRYSAAAIADMYFELYQKVNIENKSK